MSDDTSPPQRIIKKYPNRRLYDTVESRYITLQEVKGLVIKEEPFQVIDQKTGEDITRSILLQIILEQESDTNPLFSNDNLKRFIRFYGGGAHGGFSDFIGQSLQFFQDQQREFSKAMGEFSHQNPMTFWNDVTKKNMEAWSKLMQGIPPGKE